MRLYLNFMTKRYIFMGLDCNDLISFTGLFHRVIQQSGSPLAHWAVKKYPDRSNLHYKLFLSSLRCLQNSTVEIKRCLKSIDPERLKRIILADLEVSTSLLSSLSLTICISYIISLTRLIYIHDSEKESSECWKV